MYVFIPYVRANKKTLGAMRSLQRVQRAHLHQVSAPVPKVGREGRAGDGYDLGVLQQLLHGVQSGPQPSCYLLRRARTAREQTGVLGLPS